MFCSKCGADNPDDGTFCQECGGPLGSSAPAKKGKGKSPKETDTVKVHYHGTTIDGKIFDSSVDRKQPAEFPLRAVISCWTEGLQKMKVGEKGTLLCPSDIAYGDAGRPPTIAPGATLMFDVELLDIVKKK